MRVDNNAYARVCEERDELAALCASYRKIFDTLAAGYGGMFGTPILSPKDEAWDVCSTLVEQALSLPAPKALERVRVLEEIAKHAGRLLDASMVVAETEEECFIHVDLSSALGALERGE